MTTKTNQTRALTLSTLAFTVCFAIWTVFSILGVQIKQDLGLNDTEFGLVSYVWSDHLPTIMKMSDAMRSGVVWVNTPMMRELRAPFGGFHNSGVGREGGYSCEQFYTEEKTVSLPKSPLNLKRFGG